MCAVLRHGESTRVHLFVYPVLLLHEALKQPSFCSQVKGTGTKPPHLPVRKSTMLLAPSMMYITLRKLINVLYKL
jgi:hypothetical protein